MALQNDEYILQMKHIDMFFPGVKALTDVEFNPLQGDLFFKTAQKILKGESVPKSVFVEEGVYTSDNAAEVFPTRQY